jgi:Uma2 family endonuclease
VSIADPPYPVADPPRTLRMTEAEYDQWHDEELRGEWVDGEVELKSPASNDHVQLQMLLSNVLHILCSERQLGQVLGPEFAVRLAQQHRRRTPDLLFVRADRCGLIRATHLDGAPDAAFEIVSSDSVRRDWRDKYHEYEAAGVGEYWIIDPLSEVVEAYGRPDGGPFVQIAPDGERIASQVIPGFFLKPAWLWQRPLPSPLALLRELGILPAL